MFAERSLVDSMPPPQVVRDRLGDALREVELLRGLLRIAEKADDYRECDRDALIRTASGLERRPSRNGQGVHHGQ
jgi:hypothetical protein